MNLRCDLITVNNLIVLTSTRHEYVHHKRAGWGLWPALTLWSVRYYRDAHSRWQKYTDMMETNTNLIAHGVWASNKNTVIQDENSLRLASSQPFFLKSDVAAVSVDIHGRAGSSWHLIQDFTNIACDLNSTFFIHQNKGMFQKLFILWPFGFVLRKAQVDKVDETGGEFPFFGIT